jgi:hypothetical protein
MKEFIKKNPDGSVKYNTKRFFTLEDAIEAEWKANSSNFDREILSRIMEKIWDKEEYCTTGKGTIKSEKWERFVDSMDERIAAKNCPCYCERLISQMKKNRGETIDVSIDDSPTISIVASEDPHTKERVYFSLAAFAEDSSYSGYIKYCPFCGRKLTGFIIKDFTGDK